MPRPVISVLAGVNGAGKSSIGGHALTAFGLTWFNPDTYARELVREFGYSQGDANIAAWSEGVRRLDVAIASRQSFAFETTLGGSTIVRKLIAARETHDIFVWYCALRDADQHISRVKMRVAQGGHDIPEAKIRERWNTSIMNLLLLMPHASLIHAYDNSQEVEVGAALPDPKLVLRVAAGKCLFPSTVDELRDTPDWAKPLVEATMSS